MYRRQRSGGISTFLVVVLLGIAVGVGYLLREGSSAVPPDFGVPVASPQPTELLTIEPIVITPTAATPAAREITQGASFYAPTMGLTADIVETYLDGVSWDVTDLGANVGHLEGTAWLDAPGNVVLAGHVEMRDGRAGIFAQLNNLQIGDPIMLYQNDGAHVYEVRQKFITEPDDMTVVYPSTTARLTLITCSAYDFLQDAYLERYVVIADLVR